MDPTREFVEGYDPSGNDFFANMPERTALLRIRADFDIDITDLALSESSTWGNGQRLLIRGQPDHSYIYWGTLFAPAPPESRASDSRPNARRSNPGFDPAANMEQIIDGKAKALPPSADRTNGTIGT